MMDITYYIEIEDEDGNDPHPKLKHEIQRELEYRIKDFEIELDGKVFVVSDIFESCM